MREMLAKGSNHSVRHVGGDIVGLQLLRDSVDQRSTFRIIDQARLALLRGEEFVWHRNRMDLEMKNAMRCGGIDLHRDPGKLLGAPLLDNGDDARRLRVLDLLEVESASMLAQPELAIDAGHVMARNRVREILLVVRNECATVPRVEGGQPGGKLLAGECLTGRDIAGRHSLR
jgi:hypothetical protein